MTWAFAFQSLIGLLAILNPVGAVPFYLSLTEGLEGTVRRRVAQAAAVAVGVTLLLFMLVGTAILSFFGVSLAAFKIGGGILILTIGITLLHGRVSATKLTEEEAAESADFRSVAVVPLAIPLIAGPGAISTAIVLATGAPGWQGRLVLAGVIAVAATAVFITLLVADRVQGVLGKTGITIIGRVMGLLLTAIAVQFMADGLLDLFPALRG